MSQTTKRHARKKAKDLSEEELRAEIHEISEAIDRMPTTEFDDKRAIHKKLTRQKVYRRELESRGEQPTKLNPDTSKFEPEPLGTGYIAQVDAFIPDRFLSTVRRRGSSNTVQNEYSSDHCGRVTLTVRRKRPREDFVDSDEVAVEISVLYGQRKAWWQRAPDPEKVADKLLDILQPHR